MRISEYDVKCPTCLAAGEERLLGFDADQGISCTAKPPHVFDNLPGESAPITPEIMAASGDLAPTETNETEAFSTPKAPRTAEEEEDRVRAIIESRKPPAPAAEPANDAALKDALRQIEAQMDNASGTVDLKPETLNKISSPVEGGPAVVEGQFARLPGGDILCGIRVSEAWVGAMQSEGECQTPPKNAAQYLQEIIELGLLSWYSSAAPTK